MTVSEERGKSTPTRAGEALLVAKAVRSVTTVGPLEHGGVGVIVAALLLAGGFALYWFLVRRYKIVQVLA